jgi:hypothetical protein
MSPVLRSINTPVCVSVLDISTGHITKEDNDLIKVQDVVKNYRGGSPVISYGYPEGYFVYVSEDIKDKDYKKSLETYGFSKQFITILEKAFARKIKYVQFDCDGIQYRDLENYNW